MRDLKTPIQSKLLASVPGLIHGFTSKEMPKPSREALDRRVASARQVHKAELLWVSKLEKGEHEADAVATFTPGLPVGVYSADCVPTLVAAQDVSTNLIYSALAIHGGWRSPALGIAGHALRELIRAGAKTHRSRTSRYLAAIGPCIGFESFEVHEDVLKAFPGIESRGLARFLHTDEDGRAKYLIDLPGENLRQLRQAAADEGVELEVDTLGLCTVKETQHFPSHRRRDREPMGGILSFLAFE